MYTCRDEWVEWRLEDLGIRDIMTALAQIRPRDPVWGNCRQRLRELAEGENHFVGWDGEETDIEEPRCHIREAIRALDKFFSDMPLQATTSLKLV